MSRVGKKPVVIPAGVTVDVHGTTVVAKGSKGDMMVEVLPAIRVAHDGDRIVCTRERNDRQSRALHGLFRSLIQNMVTGVSQGFQKRLEIVGVGFNAVSDGQVLSLNVGYSNTVKLPIPAGVTVALPSQTNIEVSGADKQKVGQFAAEIRAARKPEPYKGTGIRYADEQVRRKAGKAFGSGG